MKGHIIKLEHVTVVPYEECANGWFCVVVASNHKSYTVGGYNICVDDAQLNQGKRLTAAFETAYSRELKQ